MGVLAALAFVLAGCGDDDDGAVAPAGDAVVEDEVQDVAGEAGTSEDGTAGDAAEDSAIGWQLTGDPGTVVELETVGVSDGVEQPSLDQQFTLEEEPTRLMFTVFIDSAEVTLAVTEGGAVTADAISGRLVDPDDPFGGIEVIEVLGSVEVPADGSEVVLTIP
jgi:hypothetical protein